MRIRSVILGLCTIIVMSAPFIVKAAATVAEWTFLVYIQADNNLAPFADFNIAQMQRGIVADSSRVNVLVQWDQPNNNKTWRYKIVKGGKVDV